MRRPYRAFFAKTFHLAALSLAVGLSACGGSDAVSPAVVPPPVVPPPPLNPTVGTSVLLPSLGGTLSSAPAINDAGIVVGASTDVSGGTFAVRWSRALNDSWSVTPIGGRNSNATAINSKGDAVGDATGGGKLWPASGGEIDLGPGQVTGINAAETIVGRVFLGPPLYYRAVVWKRPSGAWLAQPAINQSQDLPLLAGGSGSALANGITDLGVIVGGIESSACRAVRWEPSGGQWTPPIVYAGTEGVCTVGFAINQANDIAGYVGPPIVPMFLQSSGVIISLGAGSGQSNGINDAKRVVGHSSQDEERAFVWWPSASVQLLSAPAGYTAERALGINNQTPAQAVGYARGGPNLLAAIIWTLP